METLLLGSTAIPPTYLKLLFKRSVNVFQIRTVTGSLSFEVKLQVRVQQYTDYYYRIRWSGLVLHSSGGMLVVTIMLQIPLGSILL